MLRAASTSRNTGVPIPARDVSHVQKTSHRTSSKKDRGEKQKSSGSYGPHKRQKGLNRLCRTIGGRGNRGTRSRRRRAFHGYYRTQVSKKHFALVIWKVPGLILGIPPGCRGEGAAPALNGKRKNRAFKNRSKRGGEQGHRRGCSDAVFPINGS